MTNYEFYKDEIIEAISNCESCSFKMKYIIKANNCDRYDCDTCTSKTKEWFNSEYKEPIELTQTEYHILKGLDGMFKWIARDSAGYVLSVHADKPTKKCDCWGYRLGRSHGLSVFNHLFTFIKWEDDEPYLIDDLLKCVVVEDEKS